MSLIYIKCPETGRDVSTGIEMDSTTFKNLPNVGAQTKCTACGGVHVWSKADAWLSGGEGYKDP